MARYQFADKVVVVTGAGSGIGAALAQALAARGCHVALADVDEAGLARVRDSIASNAARVSVHVGDVTEPDYAARLLAAVKAFHGRADGLVNNAGIAHGGSFEEVTEARFERVLAVNFTAPIRLTRVFLQEFRAQGAGMIANVSSVFGLIAPPGQSAYSASKFGLRGFTEALTHELADEPNLHVAVILPGGVRTNIVGNVLAAEEVSDEERIRLAQGFERFLVYPPEKAAEDMIRGLERGKKRISFGHSARFVKWLIRLFPDSYMRVSALLGRRPE